MVSFLSGQFDEAVLELYDEMKVDLASSKQRGHNVPRAEVRDKNPSRETARSAALAAERLGLSATVIEGHLLMHEDAVLPLCFDFVQGATPITPEDALRGDADV